MNDFNIDEDIILIKKILDGEKELFGKLIDKYKNSIFNLIYHMVGNYSEAEDISQEVFLKAYKNLAEFKIGLKFYNLLYTIALNMSKNVLKRRRIINFMSIDKPINTENGEIVWEISDKSASVEEILLQKEERDKTVKMLDTLPLKYRSIFLLRYTGDMTYEEISKITGLPLGTVEVRLFRARKILMKKLKKMK